jgi:hypothetical protein
MVMNSKITILDLAEAITVNRATLGGKAATLAELTAAGFPVPTGIVVTAAAIDDPGLDSQLRPAAEHLGPDRFAVRSSGAARIWRMLRTPASTRRT